MTLNTATILNFKNMLLAEETRKSPKEALALYRKMIPEKLRRADRCTGCRRCNPHCPQQIDIPREIDAIDKMMDEIMGEVFQ